MAGDRNIRDYGYGSSDSFVQGTPRVKGESGLPLPCPNCGCKTLYDIEVDVRHPMLTGNGIGKGTYIGCPACPFASPMIMVATAQTP